MNLLDITIEELRALKDKKELQLTEDKAEYDQLANFIEEKIKLDKLKSQLDGVSADSLNNLIKSMTLSPGSINTNESTLQS